MPEPVKLALVGCGWISAAHVKGYNDLHSRGCRDFEVAACCDLVEEKARARAEAIAEFQAKMPRVYTDMEAMLRDGVAQAADVCLPHCFHHSAAIPLLEAGLDVMVEKPLGITVKASRKIIEAAKKHGRTLATAENVRRDAPVRACAWAIRDLRLLGEILLVNVQSIDYKPFDYENPAFKWRGSKMLTGGGMIMDSGAHFADMLQVMFGEPDEVSCAMSIHDRRTIKDAPVLGEFQADVEDLWHAVIRFKSGVHVVWVYSRSLHGAGFSVGNYYGSLGTMRDKGFSFHPFQGGGEAALADGTAKSSEEILTEYMASLGEAEKARLFPYGATGGFSVEVWDFVDAVAKGRKPEMDGEDGLRSKALCETCYESSVAGKPVKYADVLSGKVSAYQDPIDAFWKI